MAKAKKCPRRSRAESRKILGRASFAFVCAALLVIPACAQAPQQQQKDLTDQSLEDLMNIQVTSVSKKEQKLSRTAAAIFVITQEDIRRSGATNIPDLLRMVPGMDVGEINGSTWAVSARGFNAQFSNKLLVMIDGRVVYTPNFGGVFWDTADCPLEDIERIEVIRGPGGSIWGAERGEWRDQHLYEESRRRQRADCFRPGRGMCSKASA